MAIQEKKPSNFLGNLSVARRIYMLILVPLVILFITGIFAVIALNQNRVAFQDINNRVVAIDKGNKVIRRMQRDYIGVLYEVHIGSRTKEEGITALEKLDADLHSSVLPAYQAVKPAPEQQDEQTKTAFAELEKLLATTEERKKLLQSEDPETLRQYLLNELKKDTTPLRDSIHKEVERDIQQVEESFMTAQSNVKKFLYITIGLILAGTLLAAFLSYFIYHSIATSIDKLLNTVRKISAGDLNARVELEGTNELAELGHNFDQMVEERLATQARIDRDHQQLNQSVSSLLDAVFDLSERNLTVRAKVTEDATGPLADAINQFAEDTSDVLKQVREVATSVETASQDVNHYALEVNKLAQLEQSEAEETANQLENILQKLDSIAHAAQQANQVADTTSSTTRHAQETVSRTLDNMTNIRSTVQETGKRLKRLGERSQEISQIIDVINNLSERTTVLALNASMQATAAGEAGRGFSMIAEEIQRLAENSRESTNQISTLIRNIQQEANTTIATMDNTIEQVVNGSSLAEEAAQQMQATLEATNQLVTSVEKIAVSSAEQVSISKELQNRAERILDATQSTGKELLSLTGLTRNMAEYGQRLVKSVNVFKLEA
ncbi:MAG TPA: methyl-accepting chemotaxis protein [Candidatus Thiothrix moscowensis]|uniref:methyl-accepting chemotaxis protein n=1 Tax=unclassified Thiothrix TaxID=2636184 RepID=UPI001A1BE867|nr:MULTISPECIES: methyl-accepting chemotaxis protein [unclassified Thiothrix]MBJ6611190.1 methyl-accepting chemotaxis protein [Candidatus Thiothrix moscowensis]HRJ52930.1 methyl-accepting chemotaxis protein [Candidatus Thiothrix moscowensis]HRJ93480.1 methyl-accepting chemotaxis protein [Candidatus Thiothrix moscowensis]